MQFLVEALVLCLVGGAIGEGLVADFSRHNRQISGLDLEARTVRVGSGVPKEQLGRGPDGNSAAVLGTQL